MCAPGKGGGKEKDRGVGGRDIAREREKKKMMKYIYPDDSCSCAREQEKPKKENEPSNFLSTRSTAPEHPEQLIVMLNL